MTKIKECTRCLLSDNINNVTIDETGLCNHCQTYKPFTPYGEDVLESIFQNAKLKNRTYDALVPLSGGKDSTYVLYLATKKYKLRVLTYTYDNSFMSDIAKSNIESSIKKCGVDHIWIKQNKDYIHNLYRTSLLKSGEICGICGIGIERTMIKVSESYKVPLILVGHAPTEENSFTNENIYDQNRIKAILRDDNSHSQKEVNQFLIYPNLNFISSFLFTKIGRFGKKVNVLYYIDLPTDKEIAEILKKEMDWAEPNTSEYTRHFDCIAEPFSNYIREKRFGYSRRISQLSNMIRNGEISRQEAIKIHQQDLKKSKPDNFSQITSLLSIDENDIRNIEQIPIGVYGNQQSIPNRIFAYTRKLVKKNDH